MQNLALVNEKGKGIGFGDYWQKDADNCEQETGLTIRKCQNSLRLKE